MDFKKTVFSFALALLMIGGAVAQDRHELKGPKRKNYKPWKNAPTEKVMVTYERSTKKGPEAKNSKPWKADRDLKDAKVITAKTSGERVTGPKAKNAKPWNN